MGNTFHAGRQEYINGQVEPSWPESRIAGSLRIFFLQATKNLKYLNQVSNRIYSVLLEDHSGHFVGAENSQQIFKAISEKIDSILNEAGDWE